MRPFTVLIPIAVVVALLALATLPTGYAQPVAGTTGQYLPLVFKPIPSPTPTITPTPTSTPIPTATQVPPTTTPTVASGKNLNAQAVVNAFIAAGLSAEDAHEESPGEFLPRTYTTRLVFTIRVISPRGGQVFVCATRSDCNVLYNYFDALRALVGPHLYRSPNGRVIAQLNSNLSLSTGAKYKAVVDRYK